MTSARYDMPLIVNGAGPKAMEIAAVSNAALSTVRKPEQGETLEEIDALLLPSTRERLRQAFWFLAISQALYFVVLPLSMDSTFSLRAAINLSRLLVFFACINSLRGEGTLRSTLTIGAIGFLAQFVGGAASAILRLDAMPMTILLLCINCGTAMFVPWGWRLQALLATCSGVSFLGASLAVFRISGGRIGSETVLTTLVGLAVLPYVAHVLNQSRTRLALRLEDARRSERKLAKLHAALETRVAERTAEIEMANSELEGFSYTVSHDLRSPLRTISGFSQLILEERGEDISGITRLNLERIQAAADRMDSLIEDMLVLARVGRRTLRQENLNLEEMVLRISKELRAE